MPIKPDGGEGSYINFIHSSPAYTGTLYVSDFQYEDEFEEFERDEYKQERLLAAKNEDGSTPSISTQGTAPFQFFGNCNPNETERPLGTDDDFLDDIYKRWDIKRWTIVGDVSEAVDVKAFFEIARLHKVLLARFEAHQRIARSGNVSFNHLVDVMQAETFSYLTTTGLSMNGRVFDEPGATSMDYQDITETNLLVSKFRPVIEYEIPGLTQSDILKGYQLVVERRVLRPARSTSF